MGLKSTIVYFFAFLVLTLKCEIFPAHSLPNYTRVRYFAIMRNYILYKT
jgi:hypothetical protein